MIVTIDGPAGAGKSSVARELARRLGFQFLDTGAMYRAVAWHCLKLQVDLSDEAAVAEATRRISLRLDDDRVFVGDREVTNEIRSTAVTNQTQFVARNVAVRENLVNLQRQFAEGKDVVAEGRDQGTVAFPHAECKFFLTADPRERALRRQRDLAERGEAVPLDAILAQQTSRDQRDASHEVGALKAADDAVLVDTSGLPMADVVSRLEETVRRRMRR
jgi:cytidylate kinase